MIPVSAIILTYNEADNIGPCVEALRAFAEVIMVDSGSTDGTVELVHNSYPQVRVFHHGFEDFGTQRNWALDETSPRYEWILFIDADEFMEQPLAEEIREFTANPGDNVGAYIAGRNYFLNRWLRRCTFFPSYQLRLLKRGQVRYRKEGHGQREVTDGELAYLRQSWRHEGFSHGVHQWIERHNQYSTDEVELILRLRNESLTFAELFDRDPIRRRRALKKVAARLPGRAINRFLYTYVWRGGFLDGYPGLLFCLLRWAHECHITVKLAEQQCGHEAIAGGSEHRVASSPAASSVQVPGVPISDPKQMTPTMRDYRAAD